METAAPQLDPKIVNAIEDLYVDVQDALERGDADAAARLCLQAWERVPEPKFQWDFSYVFLHEMLTGILAARRNYTELTKIIEEYVASKYFQTDEYGPYFWLGSLAFERGDTDAAYQYFEKADKLTGGRCFVDEDPRYKKFYKDFRAGKKAQPKPT